MMWKGPTGKWLKSGGLNQQNGKACCRPEAHGHFVTAFPRVHTAVNNQLKMRSDLKTYEGKRKNIK